MSKLIYVFNDEDNGGEQLVFSSKTIDGGGACQELTLQSYCNSATFNLSGAQLSPDTLRDLANKLDRWMIENNVGG